MSYIVIWKDAEGQRVSTVVDSNNELVVRDQEYLDVNGIPVIDDMADIFDFLQEMNGRKIAVTRDQARQALGWDV